MSSGLPEKTERATTAYRAKHTEAIARSIASVRAATVRSTRFHDSCHHDGAFQLRAKMAQTTPAPAQIPMPYAHSSHRWPYAGSESPPGIHSAIGNRPSAASTTATLRVRTGSTSAHFDCPSGRDVTDRSWPSLRCVPFLSRARDSADPRDSRPESSTPVQV